MNVGNGSQSVHVLRGALGKQAIVSLGDGLLLGTQALSCDVLDLRDAVAGDDLGRVAQLHAAPLLDSFSLPDAVDFGHWLDDTRRDLQRIHRRAVLAQRERSERAGDLHGAVAACRQLVALDPYSGDDTRRWMRPLLALIGCSSVGAGALLFWRAWALTHADGALMLVPRLGPGLPVVMTGGAVVLLSLLFARRRRCVRPAGGMARLALAGFAEHHAQRRLSAVANVLLERRRTSPVTGTEPADATVGTTSGCGWGLPVTCCSTSATTRTPRCPP